MKKLFIIATLMASILLPSKADTISVVCPATSVTNLTALAPGYATVTSISISALTATNAIIKLYDSTTGYMTNVFPATTSIGQYATNYITCWTNYYNVQNCFTNIALVNYTNTIPGTTNAALVRATVTAAASSTTTVAPVNYNFNYGVWATNGSFGAVGITITYEN